MKDLKISLEKTICLLAALSCAAIGLIFLRGYLSSQWFNLLLAGVILPLVIRPNSNQKGSYRFAVVALVASLFSFFASVDTLIYFALLAFVFFLVESYLGRINLLAVLTALLAMPFSNYLLNTFSFPIRLWLTAACGTMFKAAQLPLEVAGNTFLYNGADFTVDPACMGLNMLITSFLVGILLLSFYQKKSRRNLPVWSVFLYLGIIFGFTIFSNLVRMFLLVFFHLLPDNPLHEVVGLLCFAFQVVLPAWALCYWGVPCFKENSTTEQLKKTSTKPYLKMAVQLLCCLLLWVASFHVSAAKQKTKNADTTMLFTGYNASVHSQGITKLESDSSLAYIKQIRWFFDSEHNPMICWRGSGYTISQVQEREIGGIKRYTGILQNGTAILYTAWWYSNGQSSTNSQMQWRWDMLKGQPAYSLINVTVEQEDLLEPEVAKFTVQ